MLYCHQPLVQIDELKFGPDAREFKPKRFLENPSLKEDVSVARVAYTPIVFMSLVLFFVFRFSISLLLLLLFFFVFFLIVVVCAFVVVVKARRKHPSAVRINLVMFPLVQPL